MLYVTRIFSENNLNKKSSVISKVQEYYLSNGMHKYSSGLLSGAINIYNSWALFWFCLHKYIEVCLQYYYCITTAAS